MSRRLWYGSCCVLCVILQSRNGEVLGCLALMGPARVLKTSVNWVARWLALAGNLYFVSAGLGSVLGRSVFCRNIGSDNTGTIAWFCQGAGVSSSTCGTCWRPEHVWNSRESFGWNEPGEAGWDSFPAGS